jgi:ATP-binding cassette subfamily F protein uup
MPLLLSCQSIRKTFGAAPLFDNISFGVSDGDHIGVIGPNGSGKSTLLRILAGLLEPDDGVVSARKLLRVGYVAQESEFSTDASVLDLMDAAAPADLAEPERMARRNEVLGRTGFLKPETPANALSGGWKKRLAIALELIKAPDLLILDEPTNHLDLEGILWLEKLLGGAPFASLVVSHDRYFLENVANSTMEINRAYPDGLFRVSGNYSEFLVKKEEFLAAQARHQETLENKVRREIEWLRRGAKARTSKSKARIDSAGELIEELSDLAGRTAKRTASIDFTGTDRRTKRLVEVENVAMEKGGRQLFRDLSFVLSPGTRLGLIGPNGSGKSTLLRLLSGEERPDAGSLRTAEGLRTLYFDQGREQLEPEVTLRKALAPEGDLVIYRDRPIHVAGWAGRFLFRNDQLELPVRRLSGGERARVLIARLMLQPADVLLLDEPTNDLDIPTLEVLEDSLLEFPGALVLVSHDRYLLDRVSTRIVGLDGAGGSGVYADYAQWEQDTARQRIDARKQKPAASPDASRKTAPGRKLSYIESREWEHIEQKITDAERRLAEAQAQLQNPDGASKPAEMQARYDAMLAAQTAVDQLYERWAELEAKAAG